MATRRFILIAGSVTLLALGFRLYLALRLPNDAPDDGRVYARLALNSLHHHSYSIEPEEPFEPTFLRVPGYPMFLAGIYRVFGDHNNTAVRVFQALISTATCWIVFMLAYLWAPSDWIGSRRLRAALVGLLLAAVCPFTSIYVATILTEVCATFLASACVLAATLGFIARTRRKTYAWWGASGALGGAVTMFRPDGGLFVAAVGFTILLGALAQAYWSRRAGTADVSGRPSAIRPFFGALSSGVALAMGFAITLLPWTVRNAVVFHRFQPIAPANASLPGEFDYSGYISWLRTWVDDEKYIDTLEWNLDYKPIFLKQVPEFAFDSAEERQRVADLLDRYNRGSTAEDPGDTDSGDSSDSDSSDPQDSDQGGSASGSVESPGAKDGTKGAQAEASPAAQGEASPETKPEASQDKPTTPVPGDQIHASEDAGVQMTPEIDAEFARIAEERIARHPFRYYVVLRARRAMALWFDTHSQYYPFDGELLPLSALDSDLHQQYWLPLFALINLGYTALAMAGTCCLWLSRGSRLWLLMLALVILPRLAFLTTLENPEPRYVVEYFPFAAAIGAIGVESIWHWILKKRGRPVAGDTLES